MSNISTVVILFAMLIVILLMFIIHYREKKDIKKAASLLVIAILTLVLGILLDETIKRIDYITDKSKISVESEEGNANSNTDDLDLDYNTIENDSKSGSKWDYLFSISPLARKYVAKRDKTLSPDWLLVLLSLIPSIVLFWAVKHVYKASEKKSFKKVVLNIIKASVLSFINFYIICYMAGWLFRFVDYKPPTVFEILLAVFSYFIIFLFMGPIIYTGCAIIGIEP